MAGQPGFLGLGSNLGDREGHIYQALAELAGDELTVEALSDVYETEPQGEVLEQPDFLNAVARIRTTLDPFELLDRCKAAEAAVGRTAGGPRHGPRIVDVDVLLLGDTVLVTDRLTLPHADLTNRRFVIEPLLELEPHLRLPDGTALAARRPAVADQPVRRVP
ncbi:MAG: 2-amino-4-hydroxy-6-hydroxymethyldihydropteridine diphosphokinase [Solirubrobacterales bacterium]